MNNKYIRIYDNLICKDDTLFDNIEFKEYVIGDDTFTLYFSSKINKVMQKELEYYSKSKIVLHMGFMRISTTNIDTKKRIHTDLGMKGKYACVYYVNINGQDTGTKFYVHNKYGHKLPKDVSIEEHDRLLEEESDNPDMWEEDIVVKGRNNRLLLYD